MAFELDAVSAVQRFHGLRVLVVGDAMLDTYIEGRASRLCKEGPVPVLDDVSTIDVPGGAANAAANARSLGASVRYLGIVGPDATGRALAEVLRVRGIDPSTLIVDAGCRTLRKNRIVASDQYVVRYDEGDCRHPSAETERELHRRVEEEAREADLVLISDYGYGGVTDALIHRLEDGIAGRAVVAIDAKEPCRFASVPATLIAPNLAEAARAVGVLPQPGDLGAARTVVERLRQILQTEHVVVTLAGAGAILATDDAPVVHVPTHAVNHAGDIGAGDSFLAAAALGLTAGAGPAAAVRIGIDAASIAVTKQRTAIVTHQELLRRVSLDAQPATTPLSAVVASLEAERYGGRRIVFTNGVFDILHAGHVQLLRRAKAFGDVLVVGINSDASTRRLKGAARPINHERDRLALVSALDCVDHALIFEEDNPSRLIRAIRPHVHVKGGDYTPESLPEAEAAREVGARIEIVSLVDGRSTTNVIQKIVLLAADGAIEAAS